MSATIKVVGSCLCGSVKRKGSSIVPEMGACHCKMCRKWGGGPLFALDCKSNLEIIGEDAVSRYDSSEWAERGFCSKCGTHLFYRLKQANQYIVPVGFFDIESNLNFNHQIFIDEKPEYYSFANETQNMTGAEVFAQYSEQ